MEDKKTIVQTKDNKGNDLQLAVLRPTNKIAQEANMAYNLKRSNLIRQGGENGERLLLRSEVEDYLEKAGIWTSKDALKMEQLGTKIRAAELLLRKGGLQLADARRIAIKMGEMRNDMLELYNKRQQLDSATVESVAENYRFGVLVTKCTVHADTGNLYFKSYDDYVERGDDEAAMAAAQALAKMLYGLEEDFRSALFENRWLKEAKLMDKNGRYTNRQGHFVDRDGKLINEDGRYIDEDGKFVDRAGRPVDIVGDFVVPNPEPFVDEDGKKVLIMTDEISSELQDIDEEEASTPVAKKKPSKKKAKKKVTRKRGSTKA